MLFAHAAHAVYTLERDGFAFVNVYTPAQVIERCTAFDHAVHNVPECKPPHDGETIEHRPLVGGGTSFVGGSLCHSLAVRQIEQDAYDAVLPLLRAEGLRLGLPYVAQTKDRVCLRPIGAIPAKETAHRDLSPNSPTSQVMVYGGWVPLNGEQYFSCVPGTHDVASDDRGGFTPLTKDEIATYKSRMQRFRIPDGHMLIFDQRIIHEVVADKHDYAVRRVFTAFELAKPGVPVMLQRLGWTPAKIDEMFETQGPFLIKSGQECRTYPKLWAVNWQAKLDDFSKRRVRKWTRDPRTGRVRHVFPAPPVAFRHKPYTDEERLRFAFHLIK